MIYSSFQTINPILLIIWTFKLLFRTDRLVFTIGTILQMPNITWNQIWALALPCLPKMPRMPQISKIPKIPWLLKMPQMPRIQQMHMRVGLYRPDLLWTASTYWIYKANFSIVSHIKQMMAEQKTKVIKRQLRSTED